MNPELQAFLSNALAQLVSGIPIGTILSLVIYYAFNAIKRKTSEFPLKVTDLTKQVKVFSDEVTLAASKMKNEVVATVNAELTKFGAKADEYQKVVEGYRLKLEEASKQNKALVAQYEITLDVLKTYVCDNKNAVVSGMAKTIADKMTNYKEHAYLAQEIVNEAPEIKEKVVFLIENYPSALLSRLGAVPADAMEDMVRQYEEKESQG